MEQLVGFSNSLGFQNSQQAAAKGGLLLVTNDGSRLILLRWIRVVAHLSD
jgi:hypothetical protein